MNRLEKMDRCHGPLQIVHDFQFVALNVKDDYSALATMGYEEKREAIRRRIDGLRENGYSGVVLNVEFRDYLQNEEAFRLLSETVDYARSLDLRVWLYDEQYYPSGSAGGLTLRDHPELECLGLACVAQDWQVEGSAVRIPSPHGHSELKYGFAVPVVDGKPDYSQRINISEKKDLAGGLCWSAPDGQWRVFAFFYRVMYELTYLPRSLRASRRYPSILNQQAMERFVDLTFRQGYEKHLGSPLGEKIEAVFTDEPSLMLYYPHRDTGVKTRFPSLSVYDKPDPQVANHPYIPWFQGMEELFRQRYGYELMDSLLELFEDTEGAEKVRGDFYQLVSAQVEHAMLDTMEDYLSKQGVALSGHYNYEEAPVWQPQAYGDILHQLGRMGIPGCDLLRSEADALRYSVACKMASSAAHIHGKDRAMIEASNMVDKDQNIDLKKITTAMALMFSHGINEITSYYSERLLPQGEMKQFCDYVTRLGSVFEGGAYMVDTLLLYPFEELCAATTPEGVAERADLDPIRMGKTCEALIAGQICFDLINIDKAEACRWEAGAAVTDYGQRIRNIVLPQLSAVTSRTAAFLNKAKEQGVGVYAYGEPREIRGLDFEPLFMEEQAVQTQDLRLDVADPFVNVMHRGFADCQMYLLVNSEERDKVLGFSIPDGGGSCRLMNPMDGQQILPEIRRNGDRIWMEIRLPGMSAMVVQQEV